MTSALSQTTSSVAAAVDVTVPAPAEDVPRWRLATRLLTAAVALPVVCLALFVMGFWLSGFWGAVGMFGWAFSEVAITLLALAFTVMRPQDRRMFLWSAGVCAIHAAIVATAAIAAAVWMYYFFTMEF